MGATLKYNFEYNGKKKFVYLPSDAKNIVVCTDFDGYIIVGFKTKFGGKKYLQTYVKLE